ncbi:MAG: STAS domain-containing protein [Candidatus Cloacimonetes bacterium]|nr:STAS domain-containing protein [Candidatus Cloacimonadota bacterium]
METTLEIQKKRAIIRIDGPITSDNAHQFQEKLDDVLETEATQLDIDMSTCRNISSAGIGKLLIFYKKFMKRNGKIEIIKSSPTVYDLLKTIKLDQLFTINMN